MTKYWISWLSRKTHLKYKAKQQKTNKINLGEGRMGGLIKIPLYTMRIRNGNEMYLQRLNKNRLRPSLAILICISKYV